MTPEQLDLIQETAGVVQREGDRFARCFYDRLFELWPEARDLFPDDLRAQRGKLVDELIALAALAPDLPAFLARARRLGERHRRYGVHVDDYPAVGDALVDAVRHVMGDAWSPAAAGAWRCLYALISESVLEGGADGLFSGCSESAPRATGPAPSPRGRA